MSLLGELLKAKTHPKSGWYEKLGIEIGKLYSNKGFPVDMSLDLLKKRFRLNLQQELLIVHGVAQWLVEHKRLSGAPEKAIERQRTQNNQHLNKILQGKEIGLY